MIGSGRRRFLAGVGSAVALGAIPAPLARAAGSLRGLGSVGNSPRQHELYRWYCARFFDFDRVLSHREKIFVDRCLDLMVDGWSHPVAPDFSYSLLAFSHRVRGTALNSSRLAIGSIEHAEGLRPLIADVLAARGLSVDELPHSDRIMGLGWDFAAEQFKVYMFLDRIDRITDRSLRALLDNVAGRSIYPTALVSVTLHDDRVSEKKVYVALRERLPVEVRDFPVADEILHTNFMITDQRGIVPQVDLRGPIAGELLGPTAAGVVETYQRELDVNLDTIAYNGPDDLTLYFPG